MFLVWFNTSILDFVFVFDKNLVPPSSNPIFAKY